MTETITPASLRAHADWLLATHGDSERLAGQLRSAANKLEIRLEAESARDEEAERLAKVHHEAGYIAEWDALHPETRDGLVAQMRAVLDRLAADGRLLPEGGTAEDSNSAGAERLQAEFARANDRMRRLPYAHRPVVTPPAVSVPDSGPDGTPEKPWPTWQDVPEGVKYVSRDHNCVEYWWWVNRAIGRHTENNRGELRLSETTEERMTNHYAPFVRVDGDKA